jgi:hypothetical protein
MDENRRESPRVSVSLYVERTEEPAVTPIHIRNLSATGFLVRGSVLAGQGGIFHATFRVRPSSGEMRVSTRGRVMHSRIDGHNTEFGIKIEGFGSPEEESAYLEYVRELAQREL